MDLLRQKANNIRANCIKMSYNAKEGHLGSALSSVDILVALFENFDFNPANPCRDRLFFSKGHACSALYAAYTEYGFLDADELATYAQPGSRLLPHPDKRRLPLLEMSSGSLGHGLGMAAGMAYGFKLRGSDANVVVVLGDGECNEGSVWEAAQFAAAHDLDNLVVMVDYNHIQSIGQTDIISGNTDLLEKFTAFGWGGWGADGTCISDISDRLYRNRRAPYPVAIIADGYPVSMDLMKQDWDTCLWHYRVPTFMEVQAMLKELGHA